jgi:ankyrin repeat protein
VTEVRERFCRAVFTRDAAGLRRLLEREPAAARLVDEPLFPFDSPAIVSVSGCGNVELLDVLLDFGADPNRRSDWWAGGFHALYNATAPEAERLIAAGAVPDACAAAHLDRRELLASLLDADPGRVHERGGDGKTPLHFARSRGVVDLLLDRGADIDARDVDHRSTPAEWMLDRRRGAGRYEVAHDLVERGASADVFLAAALGLVDRLASLLADDGSVVDLRTGQGAYGPKGRSSYHIYFWTIGPHVSPLRVAAQFEQPEAAALLRSYATPKARFLEASASGRADEARRLLAEGPTLMEELTRADHGALALAAWTRDPEAVELMMDLGFDPSAPGQDGGTALHCAAWVGSARALDSILARERGRALVNSPDPTHASTPLGWCCHGASQPGHALDGYVEVARRLLEAGAQPVQVDWETPAPLRAVIEDFDGRSR